MNINTIYRAATCAALLALGTPTARAYTPEVRQALQEAMEQVREELARSGLAQDKGITVLPLAGDQGRYVEGLLKNAVTRSGLRYVEGGESPFWEALLAEVEWSERKDDMLAPETFVRFGQLEGVQLLLYGHVRSAMQDTQRVFVEIELHVGSVETRRHEWGTLVSRRHYLPGPVEGIIALDRHVRDTLNQTMAGALESMKRSTKLQETRTIAIVPLAGDIDRYVTGRARDIVSQTHMNPVELDVNNLGQARQILRDRPTQVDAVLYGALRDLSRRVLREEILRTTYEVTAEIQLTLQSTATGEVLWSDTLHRVDEVEIAQTGEEKLVEITRAYPRLWLYVGGGIVALILLMVFIKAATRVR